MRHIKNICVSVFSKLYVFHSSKSTFINNGKFRTFKSNLGGLHLQYCTCPFEIILTDI